MNRRIRVWLIELEKVADDIDLDFTVVEVFIEFLCVCTCKLAIDLVLCIASVELEDNKAFCLSIQDASSDVCVLDIKALRIVTCFEESCDLVI